MKCIGRPKLVYVNLTYAKNVDHYDYFQFEWIIYTTPFAGDDARPSYDVQTWRFDDSGDDET